MKRFLFIILLLIAVPFFLTVNGCQKQTIDPPQFQKKFPEPSAETVRSTPIVTRQPMPQQVQQKEAPKKPAAVVPKDPFLSIYFAEGAIQIHATQVPKLELNLEVLKENPKIKVKLVGYADKVGATKDSVANNQLAYMRAKNVEAYLVMNGVDPGRLVVAAKGSAKATVPASASELKRTADRRVDFIILPF